MKTRVLRLDFEPAVPIREFVQILRNARPGADVFDVMENAVISNRVCGTVKRAKKIAKGNEK